MAAKRTYDDRCGVARALDVVGERWTLLIVRELLLGPKRFTDLRAGLPGLSADVLAQRLRELEAAGILRRHTLPPPAASRVYELTPRGQALEPVILALGHWGSVAPFPPGDAGIGADALVIALKTLFDPAAAGSIDESYELRLDGQAFHAGVADGRLDVARGSAATPAVIIETDPGTLAAVLWHGRPLPGASDGDEMTVTGSRAAARRFLRLFPLPETATA
jgi:DNA-binding HxlR family transcriptional regulator